MKQQFSAVSDETTYIVFAMLRILGDVVKQIKAAF